jgi:hypothetical protein
MSQTEQQTKPMTFADAESCLRMTLTAMKLKPADSEFLENAMRTYGDLRIAETRPQ